MGGFRGVSRDRSGFSGSSRDRVGKVAPASTLTAARHPRRCSMKPIGILLPLAALAVSPGLSSGALFAQACPDFPFGDPPLPNVGVPALPPDDASLIEDFGAALERFRGLSVDEFLREFGPRKAYRAFRFVRGDANRD